MCRSERCATARDVPPRRGTSAREVWRERRGRRGAVRESTVVEPGRLISCRDGSNHSRVIPMVGCMGERCVAAGCNSESHSKRSAASRVATRDMPQRAMCHSVRWAAAGEAPQRGRRGRRGAAKESTAFEPGRLISCLDGSSHSRIPRVGRTGKRCVATRCSSMGSAASRVAASRVAARDVPQRNMCHCVEAPQRERRGQSGAARESTVIEPGRLIFAETGAAMVAYPWLGILASDVWQ